MSGTIHFKDDRHPSSAVYKKQHAKPAEKAQQSEKVEEPKKDETKKEEKK
jgi:hypothetical protein